MTFTLKNTLIIASFTLFFSSCYYDSLEELHPAPIIIPGVNDSSSTACDTSVAITYNKDLKPIFEANCGANSPCHQGTASNSGIDLSTYDGAKGIASKLVGAITWDGTASNMPKGSASKINDCSIAKIKKWVNTGTAQ